MATTICKKSIYVQTENDELARMITEQIPKSTVLREKEFLVPISLEDELRRLLHATGEFKDGRVKGFRRPWGGKRKYRLVGFWRRGELIDELCRRLGVLHPFLQGLTTEQKTNWFNNMRKIGYIPKGDGRKGMCQIWSDMQLEQIINTINSHINRDENEDWYNLETQE